MARPGSLILVHMLEPQAVGSYFDRHRWPLHVTLLPWFDATREQHHQLRQSLERLALATVPVTVTVGGRDMFGPRHDLPVNVIIEKELLQPLHQELLNLIRLLQLPMENPRHIGPDYTPHVSQYEDRHANTGDRLEVRDFYLVELLDARTCQIIARFDLKGRPA